MINLWKCKPQLDGPETSILCCSFVLKLFWLWWSFVMEKAINKNLWKTLQHFSDDRLQDSQSQRKVRESESDWSSFPNTAKVQTYFHLHACKDTVR